MARINTKPVPAEQEIAQLEARRSEFQTERQRRQVELEQAKSEAGARAADGESVDDIAAHVRVKQDALTVVEQALNAVEERLADAQVRKQQEAWQADQDRLFAIDGNLDGALADLLKATEAYAAAGRRVDDLRKSADKIMEDWETFRRNGGAAHRHRHHNTAFAPSQGDAAVERVRGMIAFAEAQQVTPPANIFTAAARAVAEKVLPKKAVSGDWSA